MNKTRDLEKVKLSSYIENPGYFSILILGESGTGKEFMINEILKDKKYSNAKFYQPFEIGNNEFDIEKIFKNDIIIIKNLEELSVNQQNILCKAMSTQNGKIGLGENIALKRIIFTSTFEISQLRDSKEHLIDRFWDRISQLIIKLPSFKDDSSEIYKDFKSIWVKMNFQEFNTFPGDGEFRYWLNENRSSFAGNFRDLDKIAIMWHQYRILEYKSSNQKFKSEIETRVFRKVRADFESFNHFPIQKTDITNIYEFEKGKTWEQIERNFKSKFKIWAKNEYKSIKNASDQLNMPLRKMDKW